MDEMMMHNRFKWIQLNIETKTKTKRISGNENHKFKS